MKLFEWQKGRQESGYKKMLLAFNTFLLPFDMYLLYYPEGSNIPEHIDPVSDKKHYRLNFILKKPKKGGIFRCENTILDLPRLKIFRPDINKHSLSTVKSGNRLVFSIGWTLK